MNANITEPAGRGLTLADIPQAVYQRTLKPGNRALYTALSLALSAVFELDDAGTTVTDIDIRGGTPVLRIDQPPLFVKGALTVRHVAGRYRETVYAAPFRGCQLEWIERSLREIREGVA